MKLFLVIPTIRNLNFLKSWSGQFSKTNLIVVEDAKSKSVKIPDAGFKSVVHFSWEDINQEMGKNAWIFSRKNSGIRSYGFWKAYNLGADVILTLDDDCYPAGDDFVNGHLDNLNYKTPQRWVNTYPDPKWMYSRGFPYSVRDFGKVGISHGLWSGALDLDAKTEVKLSKPLNEKTYPPIRQIIPMGYYYPMCSMNLAFRREIAPLMYFPMMGGDPEGRPWPYDRHDDIWAGIFSKKIMDHLKWSVINGSPYVRHKKASNSKVNFQKENSGMSVNEHLWKAVDKVQLTKSTPKACYIELARKIVFPKNEYFRNLQKAMIIWSNLF